MIDEYIKQRKTAGENITQETYLIRNDFNFVFAKNARKPKKTSISALKVVIHALLYKSELDKSAIQLRIININAMKNPCSTH
jgi:hypothetical protein